VDRWKFGGGDASVQFERKNGNSMVLDHFFEPFLGRVRQFQFSFAALIAISKPLMAET